VLHKIGLYIRVSTEEQASNPEGSIKSQEQRLRTHADFKNLENPFGEVARVFVDRAKSGKDTNRPELQKLLAAVASREITLVMVTELSRLSRSIKDFSQMWELMRLHGRGFLSLREQFDTTSAAGEMVMYTIANIAQFERRQTSERIAANFEARAERGLFNGGSIPLGYVLDPNRRGHLAIEPEQAELIRLIFRTFLVEGTLSATGRKLNKSGIALPKKRAAGGAKPRVGHLTPSSVYRILTNAAYMGVRVFKSGNTTRSSAACWDPIVSVADFEKAQTMLKENLQRNKRAMSRRFPFLLSGLVECAACRDRMPGKSATGKCAKIPYYAHGWSLKKAAYSDKAKNPCAGPVRILASIVELLVWEKVLEVLHQPARARAILAKAHEAHSTNDTSAETAKLKAKLLNIDAQLEALAEHLASIPKGVSTAPIYAQMKKLEENKVLVRDQVNELDHLRDDSAIPVDLNTYLTFSQALKRGLQNLGDEAKAAIVRHMVAKVEILPESIGIHFKVGKTEIVLPPDEESPVACLSGENVLPFAHSDLAASEKSKTPTFFKKWCSTTLLNGGGGARVVEHLSVGEVYPVSWKWQVRSPMKATSFSG
jgi:DNA invertase Pin-like site-specific DNA recombinase